MGGQPGGKTPEERRDHVEKDIEKAAAQVQKYENMVLKYNAKKGKNGGGGPDLSSCLKTFDANKVYALQTTGEVPYPSKAALFQGCQAILEGSPQSCVLLSRMSIEKGFDPADKCQDFQILETFSHMIGTGAAIDGPCQRFLDLAKKVKGVTLTPDARATVCSMMGRDASTEKIQEALRSSSSPPSADDIAAFGVILNNLRDPQRKCKPDCSGGCCDIVATSRARIARSVDKCGKSALCRATFGDKNACDPLYDDFATTYCKEIAAAQSKDDKGDPAVKELQDAYVSVNVAVNGALNEAYGLEPHSDEENAEVIARAKKLRERLNEAPSWGNKPASKPKKNS